MSSISLIFITVNLADQSHPNSTQQVFNGHSEVLRGSSWVDITFQKSRRFIWEEPVFPLHTWIIAQQCTPHLCSRLIRIRMGDISLTQMCN